MRHEGEFRLTTSERRELSDRLRKPLFFHPAVLAKMALGIDAISSRCRFSREWIRIVKVLWVGEMVDGEFIREQSQSRAHHLLWRRIGTGPRARRG
jgi:hypothetical protein